MNDGVLPSSLLVICQVYVLMLQSRFSLDFAESDSSEFRRCDSEQEHFLSRTILYSNKFSGPLDFGEIIRS